MSYTVETLLRPPVEFGAAAALLAVAAGIAGIPELLWMPLDVADSWQVNAWAARVVVLALILRAAQRLWQGWRLRRYHVCMRRLPHWALGNDDIVGRTDLLLGLGFAWTARHTRRWHEAGYEHNQRYLQPGWAAQLSRAVERRAEQWPVLKPIARLTSSRSRWNPLRPMPDVGGYPALHGVGLYELRAEQSIELSPADRMGHILVIGTTGVGKTRLAELLITQDIKRGDPVIVLDPKGDRDLMIAMMAACVASGRAGQFYCLHLGFPEFSARYNLFGDISRITEVASRVREGLPDEGQSATFAEFVWRYVNNIALAQHSLGRKVTLKSLLADAQDIEPLLVDYLTQLLNASEHKDRWRAEMEQLLAAGNRGRPIPKALQDRKPSTLALLQMVEKLAIRDDVAERLIKTFSYDRGYYDKLVASLLPMLEKMTSGRIAEVLSPDYDDVRDPRPIFDWMTAIRTGAVVYVGLDALSDPFVAKAVGAGMLADLTSVAGRIYNYGTAHGLVSGVERPAPRWRLHADEFNEIVGDAFIPMLNKARGAGADVTAYTQSAADIAVGLASRDKAAQAIDNFNTVIMLRVQSEATARLLVEKLPEVKVQSITVDSGAMDSNTPGRDFSSSVKQRISEERVPLLGADALTKLPRGQAFVQTAGGRLFKVRFPLPGPSRRRNLPRTVGDVAKALLARGQGQPWRQLPKPWNQPPQEAR